LSSIEHERFHDDVGAYLLGALEDGERAAFEVHLEQCPICQDELARLRTASDALPRSVEQYTPPPSLKRELMRRVRAEAEPGTAPRRSLRERFWPQLSGQRLAWVSAAIVLVVGVGLGVAISQIAGNQNDKNRVVAGVVDRSRVPAGTAALVIPKQGGTAQLRVRDMPPLRPGQVYEIWLKRGNQLEPGPLFAVDSSGNGVGAIPGDLGGVSAILVTRERSPGATKPSEAPVVSAKV
jgi:anti-sigma factor RsiW